MMHEKYLTLWDHILSEEGRKWDSYCAEKNHISEITILSFSCYFSYDSLFLYPGRRKTETERDTGRPSPPWKGEAGADV